MSLSVAVVAPGAMGAAVGRRLADHGARVLTLLAGRSAATRRRAEAAGMADADEAAIAEADLVLSIVPPGEAVGLAGRLAPALRAGRRKPAFIDCNAISPDTLRAVAAALEGCGVPVLDGCIIGGPPVAGQAGPALYVSGDQDARAAVLGRLGLDLHPMAGPLGAASALKMSYAGITKGLTGLGTAMLLGAERAGLGAELRAELERSQPQLLVRFDKAIPDMLPKAYRWVAEMREIAGFLGPDDPAALMFEGAARLYAQIAAEPAPVAALLRSAAATEPGRR